MLISFAFIILKKNKKGVFAENIRDLQGRSKALKKVLSVLNILMVNYNSGKLILDEGIKKSCSFKMEWFDKDEFDWMIEIEECLKKFNPWIREEFIDENFDKKIRRIDNPNYTRKESKDYCKIEQFIVAKYDYLERGNEGFGGWAFMNKKRTKVCNNYEKVLRKWNDIFCLKELLEYTGRLPFEPWIMINISPNWKGQKITPDMICDLKNTITEYLKEGWYSRWEYALESGSDGDFLHGHIVAKLGSSVKELARVKGHCWGKKMNHQQQLYKYAKKTKCLSSALKSGSGIVQKIIINHPDMLKDKRNYLYESKKPNGHKNKKININGVNCRYIGSYDKMFKVS